MIEKELTNLEKHFSAQAEKGAPKMDLSKRNCLSQYAIDAAKTANKASQHFMTGILRIANKLQVITDVSV
jgi:hypothetical protein